MQAVPSKDEVITLHKAVYYNDLLKVQEFVQGKKDLLKSKTCKFL